MECILCQSYLYDLLELEKKRRNDGELTFIILYSDYIDGSKNYVRIDYMVWIVLFPQIDHLSDLHGINLLITNVYKLNA